MKLINLKIFTIGCFILSCCSTVGYTQNQFKVGLKTNIGLSGIGKQTQEVYRKSISTDKLCSKPSFSYGVVNSFYFEPKKILSISIECLYNYSEFEELHIYEAFNTRIQNISTEHVESRKVSRHNLLFPIKFNFEYKKFLLSGGIVNTINLISNSNYIYTIEDLISGTKGINYEYNLKATSAKKSTELGSIYLDKIYDFQFVIEVGYNISTKHKIGIEYMNYLSKNNINHIFWSEDVTIHNKYSVQTNMASICYTLYL